MLGYLKRKIKRALQVSFPRFPEFSQSFKTEFRKLIGQSDVERWSKETSLWTDWDSRTKKLALFILPGSSVLEFGAGRMALSNYLPQGCTYTPSDLVDRGPGTIVCDLNAKQLPTLTHYDVAVFSGVLEYVNDVPRLIEHLSHACNGIIASYAVTDFAEQSTFVSRRKHGWVNDYNSQELQELFCAYRFQCQELIVWRNQHLYKFVRNSD